jgi:hypothetical protein
VKWILIATFFLSACANKDWYIHVRAKAAMEVTIGRGRSHTVQKIAVEDEAQ